MNIGLFDIKKSYLNETAKGIEHKIQEKSKENRIIKYKQIRIEFCYTWVGIHKVCLGYAYAFAMFLFRRASRTAATYKMEREAVNYYHKALHLGCCSSPRSASAFAYLNCSSYQLIVEFKNSNYNFSKLLRRSSFVIEYFVLIAIAS